MLNGVKATKELLNALDNAKKPQTNADRIRQMSDEELLEFIDKKLDACIDRGPPKEDCYTVGGCTRCISEWLRQTAEGVE